MARKLSASQDAQVPGALGKYTASCGTVTVPVMQPGSTQVHGAKVRGGAQCSSGVPGHAVHSRKGGAEPRTHGPPVDVALASSVP